MTRQQFREAFRWYGWVTIAACIVALLAVTVVNAMVRAENAEKARAATAASATRRIDMMNDRIVDLEFEVRRGNAKEAEAVAEIRALAEQIRQLGGRPVVTVDTTPASSPRTSTSTTSRRDEPPSTVPTTTTTTALPRPSPTTTSTTRPCNVSIPGVCV